MKVIVAHPADPTAPSLGGGVRWAMNVATSLSNRGHEVLFLGHQATPNDISDLEENPFHFISLHHGSLDWRFYLLNLFARLSFLGLPSDAVVASHRLDIMLAFALFMPRNPKILVSTGRLYAAERLWPTWFPLIRRLYALAERHVFERIDLLGIMDEGMHRLYVGMGDQVSEKLRWTWTAVDTDLFHPIEADAELKKRFGVDPTKTTVAYAGRLDRVKNLDYLLRAYCLLEAKRSSTQLVLFGDGPHRDEVMEFAQQLELEDVVFAGPVSPADMPLVLNCADLVVLAAVGGEGSPTVLKEALACGVPVVAMNSGDIKSFVAHPLVGRVVDVLDEDAFAQAMADVIAMRVDRGPEVTGACRSTACEYSVDSLGAHWEELCAEAVARRAHSQDNRCDYVKS